MNELTRIYKDHSVRIIEKDGQPWFVAKDVAEILGYENHRTMTRRLAKDEKGVQDLHSLGGNQKTTVINEYGLFAAILKSNKKEAIDFQRWITHEVLPTIRRTGNYAIQASQPAMLTTEALCDDVQKRLSYEIDAMTKHIEKLDGSQNRKRILSIISQLNDWACGYLLRVAERNFFGPNGLLYAKENN